MPSSLRQPEQSIQLPLTHRLDQAAAHVGVTDRRDVEDIATMRVSVNSLLELQSQIGAALENYKELPAVSAWLKEHAVLLRDSVTEDQRAAAGIVLITEGDLVPNYRSRARVGWVAVVAGDKGQRATLLLITVNSAIDRGLPSVETSRGLNAWSQLMTWSWDWADAALTMRFVRDDRMARDPEVFAPINGAVKDRVGGIYTWGSEQINPAVDDFRAIIGVATSSNNAIRDKQKLLGGTVTAMKRGDWPFHERHLPLGLRLPTVADPATGKEMRAAGPPELDRAASAVAQRMFERLAAGWHRVDIAIEEALWGARNVRGHLLLLGIAPLLTKAQQAKARKFASGLPSEAQRLLLLEALAQAAKGNLTNGTRAAARRAASEFAGGVFQHAEFYRTGELHKMVRGSIKGCLAYNTHRPLFLFEDERQISEAIPPQQVMTLAQFQEQQPAHPYFRLPVQDQKSYREYGFFHHLYQLPTPVELTRVEWDRVQTKLRPDERMRRTASRKGQSGPTAPLSQLAWVQDGYEHRIRLDHAAYEILRAPVGAHWTTEARPVARATVWKVHRVLGKRLTDLSTDLHVTPLPILKRQLNAAPAVEDPVDVARRERDALLSEQSRLEKEAAGTQREIALLDPDKPSDTRQLRRNKASVAEIDARLDELESQLIPAAEAEIAAAAARVQPPDPAEQTDDGLVEQLTAIDSNPLIVVGAALEQLADGEKATTASPELAQAVAWLLNDGKGLHLAFGTGRELLLGLTLTVPSETGIPRELDAGSIELTDTTGRLRGKPTDPSSTTLRDEAARTTLMDRSHESFMHQHGWSYTFLVEVLRDWLQQRHVAFGAVNALVDAAMCGDPRWPQPSIVYAYLTSKGNKKQKTAAASGAARSFAAEHLVEPILAAYVHHGDCWPARATGLVRTPLAPLREGIALITAQPGARADRASVAGSLGIGSDKIAALFSLPDLPLPVVQLTHHAVAVPTCGRHEDCKRPNAPMTRVVAVPETMLLVAGQLAQHGSVLVCEHCRRPQGPYWDRRPLLPVHLEHWDAPRTRVNAQNPKDRTYIAKAPSQGWTALPRRRVSAATAAGILDIGVKTLDRLVQEGILAVQARHDTRGGFTFARDDLEQEHVQTAAAAYRRPARRAK